MVHLRTRLDFLFLTVRRFQRQRERKAYRKNFPFESHWKGKYYSIKQVVPIVKEESKGIRVITVCVFYIGKKK